jgi:multidrug efflux pump subunit AcrB
MEARLSRPGIDLALVMDQSIYVKRSIEALVEEGVLGAVLCSLVILLFLGDWRMTLIAVMTIPISVFSALICLYYTGNTVNVMTLAGLALAIGPLVDSAIICLENTHRHLAMGASATEAAFLGASEVAMPELVSSCCTLLVLAPLAMMPGMGQFLFKPMAMAVAFAMISAYLLSRSFVPARCAAWLKTHAAHSGEHGGESGHGGHERQQGKIARAFARWEAMIDEGIRYYVVLLDVVLRHRVATIVLSAAMLAAVLLSLGGRVRREFFPEVDAGAFEMTVRTKTGTRIEETEAKIAEVEKRVQEEIGRDLQMIISELGVTPDWSAAYTTNSGPMDTICKIQLEEHRHHSAQEYVHQLRNAFANDPDFSGLEFSFDAGGMIRGAMNEGKSTPINIRVEAKDLVKARAVAEAIEREVKNVDGVVDCRIIQRLDYPCYVIEVDRAKAADAGLNQSDVMRNVVSAFNSSIQFNKKNFWIDPISHNQYFVGVQYQEDDIKSIETLKNIPVTGPNQGAPIPLGNLIHLPIRRDQVPAELTHNNLAPAIDLVMGVHGRDLGHVSDDVYEIVSKFGVPREGQDSVWNPYDPTMPSQKKEMVGAKLLISGEYMRMQDTFHNLGMGLILASLLMYFLMVALDKSYIVPITVMSVVPLCLIGVLPTLYFTGSALNVQSLLGIIFIVGIKVANTVLMTDYAQELRRHEGLTPTEAIRKAASIRVRPVTMTALAAFFAMIPTAMAFQRGSEANAPLARAILGGLLAGEPATLFVLPAVYSLLIRDTSPPDSHLDNIATVPQSGI